MNTNFDKSISYIRIEERERGAKIRNEERRSGTRNENLGRGMRYPTTLCK